MTIITLKITGFLPHSVHTKDPKGKVWALANTEDKRFLSGWVPNVWDIFHIPPEGVEVQARVINTYYMQHANGGRSCDTKYASIQDYVDDPVTKTLYIKKLRGGPFNFDLVGEPGRVDLIMEFTAHGTPFTLVDHVWDDVVPNEWYSEEYAHVAKQLDENPVHATAAEALAEQQAVEDLFGSRYFPVFVFPKDHLERASEVVQNFKNWSNPLMFEDKVFFGVRAKHDEIGSIKEVYEIGGKTLVSRSWDW